MTPVQLRKKAAEFARDTVTKQSASFRRYGVWGDFEKPYLTLQPEYEAAQIEVSPARPLTSLDPSCVPHHALLTKFSPSPSKKVSLGSEKRCGTLDSDRPCQKRPS